VSDRCSTGQAAGVLTIPHCNETREETSQASLTRLEPASATSVTLLGFYRDGVKVR
jgi:hypothetical protein